MHDFIRDNGAPAVFASKREYAEDMLGTVDLVLVDDLDISASEWKRIEHTFTTCQVAKDGRGFFRFLENYSQGGSQCWAVAL